MTRITLIAGDAVLPATLDDTPFAAPRPKEVTLSDYRGREKVSDLPRKLRPHGAPARLAARPGDITTYAPWGNLAIFVKPFGAPSRLVRLGAFDGEFGALLKSGRVPVRIEIAR
ncbi:hypothetical protein DSD19_09680 [Rhodovulum sp. BSW8]|uniref:Cyclophilin-like domain-containing protein n=1 Tax=Rhodovulum visakhapatnamense TaxID=364297 RepID=A0A4R8FZ61_9RHOB|nr:MULTISPECIES: cyclophilin-like fold protein [Rhodovulum]RBO53214.1 hypothetical protein DSD19_09680 [Rhodovulum sp. BSW8]TDX31994.1 hypothetical protein EV657_104191 [Rhodovulum visakhapatnamense]